MCYVSMTVFGSGHQNTEIEIAVERILTCLKTKKIFAKIDLEGISGRVNVSLNVDLLIFPHFQNQ